MGNPVSSSGFTKCAQCGVHIKASEPCPFCAQQASEARRPGRGSLLAASLLSVGLVAGCDDEDDPEPVPDDAQAADGQSADAAPDVGPQPLYGIPGDVGPAPDMSAPQPDMMVAPLYGGPPDMTIQDAAPPRDMAQPSPDAGVVPPYGIPPDEDAAVPPEADMAVPAPLYGIPPSVDAAVPPPDEGMAVPLYGIPPDGQ